MDVQSWLHMEAYAYKYITENYKLFSGDTAFLTSSGTKTALLHHSLYCTQKQCVSDLTLCGLLTN